MKRGTRTKTRRNWSRPFPKMCNEPLVSESCEGGSVRIDGIGIRWRFVGIWLRFCTKKMYDDSIPKAPWDDCMFTHIWFVDFSGKLVGKYSIITWIL